MDKAIISEGLHYDRRQLKKATDPIVIDVLTFHIAKNEKILEAMK